MSSSPEDWIIPPWQRLGLSKPQAAEYIGVSAPTFQSLVAANKMPKPKQIGSRLVWDRRQIQDAFARLDDSEESIADEWS